MGDFACRSLLQKSIRRGHPELAVRVAMHLVDCGEERWLRQRLGVLIAEECWPMLAHYQPNQDLELLLEQIANLAATVKEKEASALGVFAQAATRGQAGPAAPASLLAFGHPADLFSDWLHQASDVHRQQLVSGARRAHTAAAFPADRLTALAAGWLGAHATIPELGTSKSMPLPSWAALDRHTAEGKRALFAAARRIHVDPDRVLAASFFCEGGLCATELPGSWNDACRLELGLVALDLESAAALWQRVLPVYLEEIAPALKAFEHHLAQLPELPTLSPQRQLEFF